ncbi:hypothetical protein NEFER03_0324 [Nematocida sp. LUAm3]|nr:hypothetical protein NEFER03_0324 [Nematocida sp. LUAm3]KAI5173776.1 hypothetical protein NEFER02_0292 [Nematocida sp. LUAm2]KAI5176999.1 hypothetical protein NEFER01_0324 [Nematocida sp. LUAm1]
MEYEGNTEVHDLEKKFKDSIEFTRIDEKKKEFHPFRQKYNQYEDPKDLFMDQEISKLRDLQSKVLDMQETIEERLEKETKKRREKDSVDQKTKYKEKLREVEEYYKKREERIKKEHEEKLLRIIEKLKEKARVLVQEKVAEETEKLKSSTEKKILEARIRDKTVIDKLSQMYISLKEKYKKDVQKINERLAEE